MKWNGLPVVIFGSSGISRETLHIIEEINNFNRFQVFNFLGFVEKDIENVGKSVTKGYEVITCDDEFIDYISNYNILGVFIPIGMPEVKKNIFQKIKNIKNIVFPNLIHPDVTFDKDTVLFGNGNIIASGSKLTNDIIIGNFNLINLNSTIGHDCRIGDYNVINPCAAISGNVKIGNECLIGTGANVLQQLIIGNNVTIGAGAVVIKDIQNNKVVVGVPAKELIKK